jgi:hypothetical protein
MRIQEKTFSQEGEFREELFTGEGWALLQFFVQEGISTLLQPGRSWARSDENNHHKPSSSTAGFFLIIPLLSEV